MSKADLRATLRRRRRDFIGREEVMGQLLVMTLMVAERAAPALAGAKTVAGYVSNGVEVDPVPLLFRALDLGLRTALPRVGTPDGPMTFHHWYPGDELVPSLSGPLQPRADAPLVEPDLILAPLVGFDRRLNRLGQGGGHYDRTFHAVPAARRIGLAWSVQETAALAPDAWDVPLHGIATEDEWIGGR